MGLTLVISVAKSDPAAVVVVRATAAVLLAVERKRLTANDPRQARGSTHCTRQDDDDRVYQMCYFSDAVLIEWWCYRNIYIYKFVFFIFKSTRLKRSFFSLYRV